VELEAAALPPDVPVGLPVADELGAMLEDDPPELEPEPESVCATSPGSLSPHTTARQSVSWLRSFPAAATQSLVHCMQMREGRVLAKSETLGWLLPSQTQE
jgi:hypothetical protein